MKFIIIFQLRILFMLLVLTNYHWSFGCASRSDDNVDISYLVKKSYET